MTINIAVANPQQNGGKTFLAILLAHQLAGKGSACLVNGDTTNASGVGTCTKLLGQRSSGFDFWFGESTEKRPTDADFVIVDSSRSPTDNDVSAIGEFCSIVFIPVTNDAKSKKEAAKLYATVERSKAMPMIVVNLADGGNYDSIASYFESLDADVAPNPIPRCEAAAELISQGLPFSVCYKSDELAMEQLLSSVGKLEGAIFRSVERTPTLEVVEQ